MPAELVDALAIAGRFGVGSVLLIAGAAKIRAGVEATTSIALGYRLLPASLARALSLGLPWLEIGAALWLVSGIAVRPAAALAVTLLAVFTAALVLSLARGMSNECGCLGSLAPVRWRLVLRNVALGTLLVPLLIA